MGLISYKGLRISLLSLAFLDLFVWGLPALVGTPKWAQRFNVPFPQHTYYLRIMGALTICFGLVYAVAAWDPVKYRILVLIGVIDTGLTAIVTYSWIIYNPQYHVPMFSLTLWLCALICLALCYFYPGRHKTGRA